MSPLLYRVQQRLLFPHSAARAPLPTFTTNTTAIRASRRRRRRLHTSTAFNMPTYIVTCKKDATPEQVAAAKEAAKEQGGTIVHEYNLIKGFSVSFPEGTVQTLDTNENVQAVEADQEVHTQ